jgi:hypothetical protein
MKELREMEAPSSYLTGLLHNPNFAPIYFESNHLARGHYGPTLSNLHPTEIVLPRRELLNAATCRPFLLGTSIRVLRLKPVKPTIDGFEAQITKPPQVAYSIRVPRHSTRVTAILDQSAAKSS